MRMSPEDTWSRCIGSMGVREFARGCHSREDAVEAIRETCLLWSDEWESEEEMEEAVVQCATLLDDFFEK